MPAISVFTGPDPLENMRTLLRLTPMSRGAACAVVPDSASVSAFQAALADASGGAFLGHDIHTFDSLCRDIIAFDAGIHAPDIISGHVRHAIVTEIVSERIGNTSRYAPIAKTPGFITTVIDYLKETRSHAGDLPATALSSLVTAYENHLNRLGLTDQEGIVRQALQGHIAERYAANYKGPLIIDGFYDFTETQWRLIVRMIRRFHRTSIAIIGDSERPDLFATTRPYVDRLKSMGASVVDVPPRTATAADAVLGAFMTRTDRIEVDDGSVAIHTFRSDAAEASWVAGTVRQLIDNGVSPGDIMIVARGGVRYGDVLERAVRRHTIPVEGGIPRRFSTYPLPRLVITALEASIHPEREHVVKAVQASGLTGSSATEWKSSLDPMEGKGWSCRIAPVDTPEGFVSSLVAMLDDLRIRDNLTGGGEHKLALTEHVTYERFVEILDDFVACYQSFGTMMRADDFLGRLRSFLSSVIVHDGPSPGCGVLVADANHARFVHRDIVFMTGLDDTSYPSGDAGFSLLPVSLLEKMRERRSAEEPLLFYMAMAGSTRLILSFPGIDDEGGDNGMSPYLRQIAGMVRESVRPGFHPGIAGSAWEGGASDMRGCAEHVMRLLTPDRLETAAIQNELGAKHAGLADMIAGAVEMRRTQIGTSPIDLSAIPGFTPSEQDAVFPVTGLEQYHRCPVSCFFERTVGLSIDWSAPGDIDAGTRGQILHEALAQFYRDRIERLGRARFTRDELPQCRADMRNVLSAIYGRLVRSIEGFHPVPYVTERKYYERWLELFLDHEAGYYEAGGYEPVALEMSFGSSHDNTDEAIPPFELSDEDGAVLVGGRIDRIDESESAEGHRTVRVVDYKTGKVEPGAAKIEAGTNLQIPLYLHAAIRLMRPDAHPGDGIYYDMKELAAKPVKAGRKPLMGEDWREWFDVAEQKAIEAARAISRGYYPFPDGDCKKTCPFYHVCRGGSGDGDDDA